MAGQDFNTVSFGNKPGTASGSRPGTAAGGAGGPKGGGGGNAQICASGIAAHKLDNETEELKHETVSKELRSALMKGRTAKGLTQKQLAQALNMQPQVINEYESGKAIPNNAVIAKIERQLGCKLPRAAKK